MGGVRGGAMALIAGSVITCLVFAFHPSHIGTHPVVGAFSLSQLVHSAAIIAAPLLLFGLWDVARWSGFDQPGNRLAVVCAALAMVLSVNAAVVSSFVTPAAAEASGGVMEPSPGAQVVAADGHRYVVVTRMQDLPPLVRVAVALNRGLAQANVALLSIALLLFGLGLWKQARALAGVGMLVGAFPLLWQVSGRFSPETHTMPLIAFTQGAWLIWVGSRMLSRRPADPPPANP